MRDFSLSDYKNGSILFLYSQRDQIQLDPPYQRIGGVWNQETRQLLLDSILNGFDLPKFYLHEFVPPKEEGSYVFQYAIIDGKQRLQTIWDFIDGKIALAQDFTFLEDESVEAAGLTYLELAEQYPQLKSLFDAYALDVVTIRTEDVDRIEDMFSRLNEAAPLNAPEKRNAFGGPLPSEITEISRHRFFEQKVPFADTRYRHRELAAKALWIEHQDAIVNTKKSDLDGFVKSFKELRQQEAPEASAEVVAAMVSDTRATLERMAKGFIDRDPLLRQVGLITLYLHLYRNVRRRRVQSVRRSDLEWFEKLRLENKKRAESDTPIEKLDKELLEFDKHSQTPNDGYALRIRLRILLKRLRLKFGTTYSDDIFSDPD